MKKFSRFFVLLIALALSLIFNIDAQNYKFRHFSIEEGNCHHTVYTITQDKDGFLWSGTGVGICRFDGFGFQSDFGDTLSNAYANTSYVDSQGRLWFGHGDGSITLRSDHGFETVLFKPALNSMIVTITEDRKGNIYCASQNHGVAVIAPSGEKKVYKDAFSDHIISYLHIDTNDNLLVATNEGLYTGSLPGEKSDFELGIQVEELAYIQVQDILHFPDSAFFLVGTEGEGLYRLKFDDFESGRYEIRKYATWAGLEYSNVQSLELDPEKNLWVSTFGEGLTQLIYSAGEDRYVDFINYNDKNGLENNFIKQVFHDREGITWVATYGNGLAALSEQAFVFYEIGEQTIGGKIISIEAENGYLWMGGENGLIRADKTSGEVTGYYDKKIGLPTDDITALFLDYENDLWIGTRKNGIYLLPQKGKSVRRMHVSQNSLENTINRITGIKHMIYCATNNGVVILNKKSGSVETLNTADGLPHNRIRDVFIDSDDIAWIATKSDGITAIDDEISFSLDSRAEIEFTSITEDKNKNLWTGTDGYGVFMFRADTLLHFSTDNGLKSNYCYAVTSDKDGNIWIGHRVGLSKIIAGTYSVISYGREMGITGDVNYNAVTKSKDAQIFFGTTDGLLKYDISKDKQESVPPALNVTSVIINDKEVDFKNGIVLPYGKYKIRFNYIGLNYSSPENVVYEYMLEGFDENWLEKTTNQYTIYSNVTDGNYTFLLKACNGEGQCTEMPLELSVKVKIPFWKTWWFISLSVVVLILAVYGIIKYRERRLIEFQRVLEKKLDERTREVVSQKEEIELKNRDITDSINYAQRIQASILPSIKKLQDNFSGSFVFYQPRDIVSGDFYWFDNIGDNRFIIVCADSTGHGVPGAFMSMIGTTLIKDICMRPGVNSPSDILTNLDLEIHETLNQNLDAEKSNDGMDIIVCEIDLNSCNLRIASAMRPLIIYQNGEQIYVSGSKSSIGGSFEENENKTFENQEFSLSKGDLVYMFSDGYPDQFGGPVGKKFKMVRLRNLLRDIHTKPMDEQYHYVKSNFNLWKEDYDQVDDVLFMGLKI
ncbi:MAG: two-component regulator propeller domain-containing protein [bacterium]